jgi:hypothetical protein
VSSERGKAGFDYCLGQRGARVLYKGREGFL